MKYSSSIFLLIICLVSCDNAYDAEKVAQRYCDCMKSNGSPKEFEKASKICGDKLVAENRYVKLYSFDMRDSILDNKISNETRDSVKAFVSRFTQYTNTNCCEETLGCPDSTSVK